LWRYRLSSWGREAKIEGGLAYPDGHVWDAAYNPFTDLT
jgi:hypothetical protein